MKPADTQLPPNRKDQYLRPAGPSSLVVPSDLVPAKRGVDVVLVGRARAPGGQPVASFATRLVVGSIDKRIEVFAERFFTPSGEIVQAARAAEVPLVWERAAGGQGTPNPIGMSPTERDNLGRVALPQLQPAGMRATDPDQAIEPVCYGPVAPSWPGRVARLGAHAAGWSAERWWTRPLPDGFDVGYFNVAPDDQRLERLVGDELVVLENLVGSDRELRTRLPVHAPIGTLTRRRGKAEPLELVGDTVWIDVDREICTITWRGLVTLWHPSEQGRVEIDWAERPPRPAVAAGAPPAMETARGIGARWLAMPTDDPDGGVTEPSYLPDDDGPPIEAVLDEEYTPVRPFDGDETVPGGAISPRPLPFLPPRPGQPNLRATATSPSAASGHLRIGQSPKESTAVTSRTDEGADAAPLPFRRSSAGVDPMAARLTYFETGSGLPLLRVDACARVAAMLACRPEAEAQILAEHGLDTPCWKANDAFWSERIREETSQGRAELLRQYDTAYVQTLERERGPLHADEYARLVVGAERGQAAQMLQELSLPAGAMVRIERVFLRRVVEDAGLGEAIRRAIDAERGA